MTLPAVIFDLDGTLVDSEPNYYEAGRRLLAAHGVADFTWEQHERYIGISTKETLEALSAEYGLSAPLEQLLDEKNRLSGVTVGPDPISVRDGDVWTSAGVTAA
ncbi:MULTISPECIES: HAD hydrolase-like protein [unclassified Streptomyces]|uniref:HAD family hydrolase n=1 Tax=unclassified Streptomyces TaxID=2593676 RepID=UPI0032D57B04